MHFVIDGYNLIHAGAFTSRGPGPPSLHNTRLALLDFLANMLTADECARTVVVFDAKGAPPGLPRQYAYRGLTVQFAPRKSEADDLIEEIIQADHAPRRMTVVSSDHRLQQAARRRRARAVDCEVWIAEIRRRPKSVAKLAPPETVLDSKPGPGGMLSAAEVEAWLAWLDGVSLVEEDQIASDAIDNPFPPGYCEDLDEEADLDG